MELTFKTNINQNVGSNFIYSIKWPDYGIKGLNINEQYLRTVH